VIHNFGTLIIFAEDDMKLEALSFEKTLKYRNAPCLQDTIQDNDPLRAMIRLGR
jgi:hypothetical protein